MGEKAKKGLFVFIFIVLLLPFVQQQLPFIESGRLHGYYTNSPDTSFTWKGWFDGSYQPEKDNFVNDHIGFRPDMLRLTGQVDFSLFQILDYGGIVVGSDNYLYYSDYADAYFGKDFIGYETIRERMIKLKAIQDTMARLGKTLVMVYAPCKVWYYSEHIPRRLLASGRGPNNYEISEHIGDSLGIRQVDFNKWFLAMKGTTHELLYSRLGIHWTNYGAILAADSLLRYMRRVRGIQMPYPTWEKVVHTTGARDPDNDMANIANLIYPMSVDTFCYPELKYAEDEKTTKPNVVFAGDSYTYNLITTGVMQHIHSNWAYLFYFRQALDGTNWENLAYVPIEKYDWKGKINKADYVVILNTPMNCKYISGGFIEAAYDYYYPKK